MVLYFAVLSLLISPNSGNAQSYVLAVAGLGGEPRYEAAFREWASAFVETATTGFGIPSEDAVWLAGSSARADAEAAGPATKNAIGEVLAGFAARAGVDAMVWIVLFGHGSETGGAARFHLPGPDLVATELASLLEAFPTQPVVVVNAASASGGWVEALAGPGRTIITATRSASERHETRFGGYFVASFADAAGDTDMNGRVSLLEAFLYARAEVERAYEGEQRLLAEHALLDDDGDGRGNLAPSPDQGDGAVAATLFLQPATAPGAAAGDPALAALYAERDSLERTITALRGRKSSLTEDDYERELERLLLDLGRVNRAIRAREGAKPE
jgi:hypothetical protein